MTPLSEQDARRALAASKRIVVKIGSALLASLSLGIDPDRIARFAAEVAALRTSGREVILVSSGAVAAGTARLGLSALPESLRELQAAAAVGQGKLMRHYAEAFARFDIPVGQMLLTRDGLDDRFRYLNARNTLNALIAFGAVPIVNENDTVMVEEIRFGDNDRLSGLVAAMAGADALVILSDIDGLHERPPSEGESPVMPFVPEVTSEVEARAGLSESGLSRGGMASKLMAARSAAANGIHMVIASGKEPGVLERIFAAESVGTLFPARETSRKARKQWLAGRSPSGSVAVDAGAAAALTEGGKSLLPIGVLRADPGIQAGDAVAVVDEAGNELALGICNFTSGELDQVIGKKTDELPAILGEHCETTVVHRDNLVLLTPSGG